MNMFNACQLSADLYIIKLRQSLIYALHFWALSVPHLNFLRQYRLLNHKLQICPTIYLMFN